MKPILKLKKFAQQLLLSVVLLMSFGMPPAMAGFFPLEDWRASLPALNASVTIGKSIASGCSGAYISDQGHILTASHCLDRCVFDRAGKRSSEGPLIFCSFMINGVETSVQVLQMARCPFASISSSDPAKAKGCSQQSDIAVILPQQVPSDFVCLSRGSPPKPGDPVLAVGNPIKTNRSLNRNDPLDSRGDRSYLSSGRVLPFAPRCTIERDSEGRKKGELVEIGHASEELASRSIQATVDMVRGSSGGPLLNERGEVVGVGSFSAGERSNPRTECRGAAFFAPLTSSPDAIGYIAPGFSMDQIVCKTRQASSSGFMRVYCALEKDCALRPGAGEPADLEEPTGTPSSVRPGL